MGQVRGCCTRWSTTASENSLTDAAMLAAARRARAAVMILCASRAGRDRGRDPAVPDDRRRAGAGGRGHGPRRRAGRRGRRAGRRSSQSLAEGAGPAGREPRGDHRPRCRTWSDDAAERGERGPGRTVAAEVRSRPTRVSAAVDRMTDAIGRDRGLQRRDGADHQDHRRDRVPDQPARPQRRRRGRPGRRGRQGLRRRRRGGPQPRPAQRPRRRSTTGGLIEQSQDNARDGVAVNGEVAAFLRRSSRASEGQRTGRRSRRRQQRAAQGIAAGQHGRRPDGPGDPAPPRPSARSRRPPRTSWRARPERCGPWWTTSRGWSAARTAHRSGRTREPEPSIRPRRTAAAIARPTRPRDETAAVIARAPEADPVLPLDEDELASL